MVSLALNWSPYVIAYSPMFRDSHTMSFQRCSRLSVLPGTEVTVCACLRHIIGLKHPHPLYKAGKAYDQQSCSFHCENMLRATPTTVCKPVSLQSTSRRDIVHLCVSKHSFFVAKLQSAPM
jgi:hypothetical protein